MNDTANLVLSKATASRRQDISRRLLATLTLFALTASAISMGILMIVFARILPAVGPIIRAQSQ